MRSVVTAATLLALPLVSAFGQSAPRPGDRVRVTAPAHGLDRHVGVVARLDAETITVDSMQIPRAHISQFDVFHGRKGNAGTGAILGALTGGLLLGLGGAIICSDAWICNEGTGAAYGAVGGVLSGALLGAGIGLLIRSESWDDRMSAVTHPGVTFTPAGSLGLGWTVRF